MQLYERSVVFQLLHREHEEIQTLLGELVEQKGDVERVRRLLLEALEHHMAVEEAVFYPALGKLRMLASFVDRMRVQHQLIRDALSAVCRESLGGPDFSLAAGRLNELVDQHVVDEETRAFSYAAEHLAGELEGLAVEMEHRRQCERGAYGVG